MLDRQSPCIHHAKTGIRPCRLLYRFFLFSLCNRIITADDAWFAEQAYWFARDGYVDTDLFEGVPVFTV